jgi:hypothetical protein
MKGYISKLLLASFIIIQSCSTIPKIDASCKDTQAEVHKRYSLFNEITKSQISKRSNIEVPTYSKLDSLSVFSQIVKSVKQAKLNSKLIAVDLRHYKSVHLGNIVVSNIKKNLSLNFFLKNSKYSQGFFVLINFGEDQITIIAPTYGEQKFERQEIQRADLQNVELVFNVGNSQNINANMKFSKNQRISLLAKNIKNPFRVDLREASNSQFHFGKKWIMSVYDIQNSEIEGGKKTSGYYVHVNNENVKNIRISKFDKSKVRCYSQPSGIKFEDNIRPNKGE